MNMKIEDVVEKYSKKEQLIDKINRDEVKKESIKFKIKKKIIAIISVLSIFLVGGTVFAIKMPEKWKNSIKEFLGIISNENYDISKIDSNIIKESNGDALSKEFSGIISNENYDIAKIDSNIIKESNGYTLTLENYGFDYDSLLITYDLITAKEIDLEYPSPEEPDYSYDTEIKINDTKNCNVIFNKNYEEEYETYDKEITILIYKVNSFEYKIYELYNEIDSSKISDSCTLNIDFTLTELSIDAGGLIYDILARFEFELPIENDKINNKYEEYNVINKEIVLNEKFSYGGIIEEDISTLTIDKIVNTYLFTKLLVRFDGLGGIQRLYTVSIVDEHNNILLDKDIEYVFGTGTQEYIIIPSVCKNSKLKITLYGEEYSDERVITAENDVTIDLNEIMN